MKDLFCHNLKTNATTLEELTALFLKERKERGQSLNVQVVDFKPLNWGTSQNPQIAEGWITIIYTGDQV